MPSGFRDVEKCVVVFGRSHLLNSSIIIFEVGAALQNMSDHVDIGDDTMHLDLPSAYSKDVTKVTAPLDSSINILGIVWERGTADVFMSYCFPESKSLQFIAVSVPTSEWVLRYRLKGFIYVVAEHDDTRVNINPSVSCDVKYKGRVAPGGLFEFSIAANTRLEITSFDDLTGTEIVSNKPTAVYSGHACGNVPSNVSGCDQLVEQIPPVQSWGAKFIVSTFERNSRGDYIKVVTAYNDTSFSIFCEGYRGDYEMNALQNKFIFLQSSSSCYINATKPILIAQFSVGEPWSEDGGDPSMAIVPHLHQYSKNISFLAPEICGISGYSHFVSVYYTTQNGCHDNCVMMVASDVLLDGSPIMPDDIVGVTTPDQITGYYVAKIPVNPGIHSISATNGSISVIVYGANTFEYYSYSIFNPV